MIQLKNAYQFFNKSQFWVYLHTKFESNHFSISGSKFEAKKNPTSGPRETPSDYPSRLTYLSASKVHHHQTNTRTLLPLNTIYLHTDLPPFSFEIAATISYITLKSILAKYCAAVNFIGFIIHIHIISNTIPQSPKFPATLLSFQITLPLAALIMQNYRFHSPISHPPQNLNPSYHHNQPQTEYPP